MDLKCLIKLLVEKEYIKEVSECVIDKKTILKVFECDVGFNEIYRKIHGSKHNDSVLITKTRSGNNRFCVFNIKNFADGLVKIGGGREEFGFRADHHYLGWIPIQTMINTIRQHTRFNIIRQDFNGQIFFELRDSYIVESRINKQKEREDEVIGFLNQLP